MKTKISSLGWGVIPVFLFSMTLFVNSCQQEEIIAESDQMLKSAAISALTLDYPEEAVAGEDFMITFSSTCGKVMLERGYIEGDPIMEEGVIVGYEKIYIGLSCYMENLQWEEPGDGDFLSCEGGAYTLTLDEPGTYVYRAKLNHKAFKNTACPDCDSFRGNLFECFMITIVEGVAESFTDARDGNTYKSVKIGDQTWMAENLAYLPSVSPPEVGSTTEPYYYVYGYKGSNVAEAKASNEYSTYGVLYNWPAAMDDEPSSDGNPSGVQGVCPAGWHLPSDAEWKQLEMFLGMTQAEVDEVGNRGTDQAIQMKATYGWYEFLDADRNGTNTSGFSALPGGLRWNDNIFFSFKGIMTAWWSSTESTEYYPDTAWKRELYIFPTVDRQWNPIDVGISVRCVQD